MAELTAAAMDGRTIVITMAIDRLGRHLPQVGHRVRMIYRVLVIESTTPAFLMSAVVLPGANSL